MLGYLLVFRGKTVFYYTSTTPVLHQHIELYIFYVITVVGIIEI